MTQDNQVHRLDPQREADAVHVLLAMAAETPPRDDLLERWQTSREQGLPLLAIWDFVLAVEASLTDASAAAEFRLSVLGELFRQLPAEPPARADLLERADSWSATFTLTDAAEKLLPDWRHLTFPEDDCLALERLLRIGDRLGLFALDAALDERIGQYALGPAMLDHADWAVAFGQALCMPAARDLWRGVMRSMTFQEADRLEPLEPLLQHPDLTRELEALVLDLQNPWLFSFLTIRRDLADPLRAFSEGFVRVAAAFPDLARADLLRTAFMAAFGTRPIGVSEARGAIAIIEAEGFGVAACGLLRDFEQVLDREGVFERPDVPQHELVAALARDLPATALASFPVIEAHAEFWPPLAEGRFEEVARLEELLDRLQGRGDLTRDKLLSWLADMLLNGTLPPEAAVPPAVIGRLRERVAQGLAKEPPAQAADWARAFGNARDLGARFPTVADGLLQDFEAAFTSWQGGKNPWKAVAKALAAMRAPEHERDWKTRYAERIKGPPSRLAKLMKPVMALALLAAIGLGLFLGIQRLGPALAQRLSTLSNGGVPQPTPEPARTPGPPMKIRFVPEFDPGVAAPPGSTGRRFGRAG